MKIEDVRVTAAPESDISDAVLASVIFSFVLSLPQGFNRVRQCARALLARFFSSGVKLCSCGMHGRDIAWTVSADEQNPVA
eukprot:3484862-Rhodomonas_salina.1